MAFDGVLRAARRGRSRALSVVYLDHCAQLSGGELALARLLPALEGVDAHVILGEHGPLEARLREAGATVEVRALDASVATTRRDEVTAGALGVRRVVVTAADTLCVGPPAARAAPRSGAHQLAEGGAVRRGGGPPGRGAGGVAHP